MAKKGKKPRGELCLQAIIFPQNRYTRDQAETWLKKFGYAIKKLAVPGDYWRYQQNDYQFFQPETYQTIPIGKTGIQFVAGIIKRPYRNQFHVENIISI